MLLALPIETDGETPETLGMGRGLDSFVLINEMCNVLCALA